MPFRLLLLSVLSVALLGATLSARAASLTVGANVNITRLQGYFGEEAVAVNPRNPSQVFVASNSLSDSGLFAAYSTNGGSSFSLTDPNDSRIADGDDGFPPACCDPSAVFDEYGNLFVGYIDGVHNVAAILLSTNGGRTFTLLSGGPATRTLSVAPPHRVGSRIAGADDQPTVTAGAGSVWITFQASSHNVGAASAQVTGLGHVSAFSEVQEVPDSTNGNFGDISIGPNGQVMVAYQDNTGGTGLSHIFVALDPDGLGPAGFNPPVQVTSTNVGGFEFIPAEARRAVDAEAGLAYDRSPGPHRGRAYIVYNDQQTLKSNALDVFVRFSDNNGASWSPPGRVNDDISGRSHFLPRIALDQATGWVAASWYDCRNDAGAGGPGDTNGIPNDDAEVWASASLDGGLSFLPNIQVSRGASNAAAMNDPNDYGDYTGLAFQSGVFYPSWADNSNSTGDNPNGRLSLPNVYIAPVRIASSAARLRIQAPSVVARGAPFSVTVTALDASGQLVPLYAGAIHFTSSDPSAVLPADYTFTPADAGSHTFTITLQTAGAQTISATDVSSSAITGSASVTAGVAVHSFSSGLAMISLPFDYTATTTNAADLLGLSRGVDGGAPLATFDPVAFRYRLFPNLPGPDGRKTLPGRGYWILETADRSIPDVGASVTAPFEEILQPGWNMIGDPYTTSVALSALQVRPSLGVGGSASALPLSLPAAQQAGLIGSTLWRFAADVKTYTAASSIDPYVGYWIFVDPGVSQGSSVVLHFP